MVELRERKTEIGIGLFLFVCIGAWLMIPSVFSADTIILVNPDTGGGPVSCLPSGALILAQNLTDLCDVTITAPNNGEIIQYNGTQWINVSNATFIDTTVCTNQPTGEGLCINDTIELKNLVAGGGIGIASNATHIIFFNNGVTSLEVSGGGLSGAGITLTGNVGDIQIANSEPENTKLCESVASGGETTLACTLSLTGGKGFIIQSVYSSSLADTWALRFNADGGNNYAARTSVNGGADATTGSIAHLGSSVSIASQQITYNYECEQRGSSFEKYCYGFRMTSANGATNVPSRVEFAVKWVNTSSVVTTVDLVRTAGTGTLEANSYIVVWGLN